MKQRCRRLCNDRRHSSYFTSDDTGVIKLRRMRWVGRVLHIGDLVTEFRISVRKNSATFGRVILGQIYKMWRGGPSLSDEWHKTHAAFVNKGMNAWKDRKKLVISSPPERLLGAEGWLCIIWLGQTHYSAYSFIPYSVYASCNCCSCVSA